MRPGPDAPGLIGSPHSCIGSTSTGPDGASPVGGRAFHGVAQPGCDPVHSLEPGDLVIDVPLSRGSAPGLCAASASATWPGSARAARAGWSCDRSALSSAPAPQPAAPTAPEPEPDDAPDELRRLTSRIVEEPGHRHDPWRRGPASGGPRERAAAHEHAVAPQGDGDPGSRGAGRAPRTARTRPPGAHAGRSKSPHN